MFWLFLSNGIHYQKIINKKKSQVNLGFFEYEFLAISYCLLNLETCSPFILMIYTPVFKLETSI